MQKALKRWMHATAILFAVMLIGANTGLAQVSVTLDDITGKPLENVTVGVHVSGVESGTPIHSFGFDVVTGAGVTFSGYDATGTLVGDANFLVVSGDVRVGGATGGAGSTDVTTSGTFIFLTFDLDAISSGVVTLENFTFNDGNPAIADPPVTANFTISDRIIAVTMEHETRVGEAYTNTGQPFWIVINLEDELLESDDVASFGFEVHFDATMMEINQAMGVVVDGGVADVPGFNIDFGLPETGVLRVGGFRTLGPLVGDGLFLKIAATALEVTGTSTLSLSDVEFSDSDGLPMIYATRTGTLWVLDYRVANEDETGLPSEFTLKGNYPNPFNPTTTIQFDLPESADVTIDVMDLLGRRVLVVPMQAMSAGANRSVRIDASSLSSGIYLYRVTARTRTNANVKVGTMTLLK